MRSFGSVVIYLFNHLMLQMIGADSSVRVHDAARLTLRSHLFDVEWPLTPSDAAQNIHDECVCRSLNGTRIGMEATLGL